MAFIGISWLAVMVLALTMPDNLQLRLHRGTQPPSATAAPMPSPSASVPAPTSSQTATISPVPAAVVLKVRDLPNGYHVVKAGPTIFNEAVGASPPTGWDVVFAPDADSQAPYLLIESVVAVFPDAATAVAAVQAENAAEQTAHAVRQPSISGLAAQQAAWIQPAPDRAGYGIVRITWQELNVVGQVGALGPISTSEPQQTALLAMIQRDRIGAGT